MNHYLLIESRDPIEHTSAGKLRSLATDLLAAGHSVTVFLIENGVLGARRSPTAAALAELASEGATVMADAFSLRERGIPASRVAPRIQPAPIEALVDRLESGAIPMWH